MRATLGGFTLIETVVAIAILEIGLAGTVGVVVIAQRTMSRAERLHRATQETASVADSLLSVRAGGGGELATSWGRVRWELGPGGGRVRGEDPFGATLLSWWLPIAGATQ